MAASSNRMPLYAVVFMVFTLANVGLPGTSGFVGEFLTLIGAFQANSLGRDLRDDRRDPVGGLCALSLSPRDLRRARKAEPDGPSPISRRARSPFSRRCVVLTIYYGVHPQPILDASAASVDALVKASIRRSPSTKTAGSEGAARLTLED